MGYCIFIILLLLFSLLGLIAKPREFVLNSGHPVGLGGAEPAALAPPCCDPRLLRLPRLSFETTFSAQAADLRAIQPKKGQGQHN